MSEASDAGKKVYRPEPKPVTTEYVRKTYAQSPIFYQDRRTVAHWQTPDDIEYAGHQFDAGYPSMTVR